MNKNLMKRAHGGFESLQEGYKKLKPQIRNKIFYYSLFDPSGWEESSIEENLLFKSEIKKELLYVFRNRKLFKNFSENFNSRHIDNYIKTRVYTGILTNEIICLELDERKIKCSLKTPEDLTIKHTGTKIEIKRLSSTLNLNEEMEDIERKIKTDIKVKWIILLLFPVLPNEHFDRVKTLTYGYHNIQEILTTRILKRDGNIIEVPKIIVLVTPIRKDFFDGKKTSLDSLIEKTYKHIKGE